MANNISIQVNHSAMRYAVKFAYDGTKFQAYQSEEGMKTVEGTLINALKKARIVDDVSAANLKSASRTDKGVSAIGNVFAFNTDFGKENILPSLNHKISDIWSWGIAPVPDEFNPRHAKMRLYRYHLPASHDEKDLALGAKFFVGEHDFKSFCKKPDEDTVRTIDSINVKRIDEFIIIDFKAHRFMWNMVRRIVAALIKFEQKKVKIEELEDALQGERLYNFGLAPPENLVLMDVQYDFEFETDEKLVRRIETQLDRSLLNLKLRISHFEGLKGTISEHK